MIEDIVTTGGQVVRSTEDLRNRSAGATHAVCVSDREQGGASALDRALGEFFQERRDFSLHLDHLVAFSDLGTQPFVLSFTSVVWKGLPERIDDDVCVALGADQAAKRLQPYGLQLPDTRRHEIS